jgi:hypothetical protein
MFVSVKLPESVTGLKLLSKTLMPPAALAA